MTIHGILYPPTDPNPKPRKADRIRTYKTRKVNDDGSVEICQHYMDNDPPDCIEYPRVGGDLPTEPDPSAVVGALRSMGWHV